MTRTSRGRLSTRWPNIGSVTRRLITGSCVGNGRLRSISSEMAFENTSATAWVAGSLVWALWTARAKALPVVLKDISRRWPVLAKLLFRSEKRRCVRFRELIYLSSLLVNTMIHCPVFSRGYNCPSRSHCSVQLFEPCQHVFGCLNDDVLRIKLLPTGVTTTTPVLPPRCWFPDWI